MTHEAFRTTLKDTPLQTNLQIASRILAGELAAARPGRRGDSPLSEAVTLEDAIPYNEPPVWHHPLRRCSARCCSRRVARPRPSRSTARTDALPRERLVAVRPVASPRGTAPDRGRADRAAALREGLDARGRDAHLVADPRGRPVRRVVRELERGTLDLMPVGLESDHVMPSNGGVTVQYAERTDGFREARYLAARCHRFVAILRARAPYLPSTIVRLPLTHRGHGEFGSAGGYRYADLAATCGPSSTRGTASSPSSSATRWASLVASGCAADHPSRVAGTGADGVVSTRDAQESLLFERIYD